ncbi:MAG: septation protein A [Pseudomonadota bacterium]
MSDRHEQSATTGTTEQQQTPEADVSESQALLKLAIEAGPLGVFFLTNSYAGKLLDVADDQRIFWATGFFMIATAVALTASRALFGRLPIMPLVSGAFVFVFGALTLWLQDEHFIKIKPTIVNLLFAAILFTGLAFKTPLLKFLFDTAFRLTETGWKILTFRWSCFFVFLAVLNEVVWRTTSTDFWAGFKLFGVLPLTIAFAIAQIGVLTKHQLDVESPSKPQPE